MRVRVTASSIESLSVDSFMVGIPKQATQVPAWAGGLDEAAGGLLRRLLTSKDIRGKFGELTLLYPEGRLLGKRLLAVGLGDMGRLHVAALERLAGKAARQLADRGAKMIACAACDGAEAGLEAAQVAAAIVRGAAVGLHGGDLYKSKPKKRSVRELIVAGTPEAPVRSAAREALVVAEAVNLARDLINGSPDKIVPSTFARHARRVAREVGLSYKVLDEKQLKAERMHALLGVARGSVQAPRLVILEHRGAARGKRLALVGKGVTFDSGGLSLKPAASMEDMKTDMAGAAAVLGAMRAIAQLKLKRNVVGVMPCVENMPSGHAYKPGEVVTARNGKTIEVLNTDAEGRMILADALCYTVDKFKPAHLVDLATLTGSIVMALGTEITGLMTNNETWGQQVMQAGQYVGERSWMMPMFDLYRRKLESPIADLKHIGGRQAGALTAAKFLEEFVGQTPWTHLDIAGTSTIDSRQPHLDRRATGVGVRTLVELVKRY